MHYVYDFDSTLYATIKLWNRWVEIIERYGYATPDLTTIEKSINERDQLPFTPRRHAEFIGMDPVHIERAVCEQDEDVAVLSSSLVFEDVLPFLKKRHQVHQQSLLSFGDHDYQMGKIEASGVKLFVRDIHIAGLDRGKSEILRALVDRGTESIIFIDDHTKHLQNVHDAGLPVELVRMRRPGEPHTATEHPLDDVAWRVVSSLDELGASEG